MELVPDSGTPMAPAPTRKRIRRFSPHVVASGFVALLLTAGPIAWAEPADDGNAAGADAPDREGAATERVEQLEADEEEEGELGDELEPAATKTGQLPKGLEEVRVVARRRDESLQDTPVAVTALGASILEDAQIREVNQIQDLVPNLTWNTGASGVQNSISIRGVGKASEDIVFDPGVGVYIDGVLLSRDVGQLLPMLDVEQIEVLRGPQGTLFGKNNVGGAINMITVKPRDDYEASMMLGAGNFYLFRSRAMVNAPLIDDKLFLRASFASERNDGWMADVTTGQRSNDRGMQAGMLALRALPDEALTIDLAGSWSRDHTSGRGGKCIYVGPSVAAQFAESPLLGAARFSPGSIQANCQASEALPNDRFTADDNLIADVESYGIWGTIAYEFGDLGPVEAAVAKSITAWRQQKPRQRDDTDMTALPIIQRSSLADQPTYFGGLTMPGWQQQITQEFQFQNDWWNDRIHSTTGVFLFWDQAFANQELLSLGGAYISPGGLVEGLTPSLQQVQIDNFDVAVYHQSTWDITDQVSLTGGVRWTRETKDTHLIIHRYTNPPPAGQTTTPWVQINEAGEATFTEWTPTASLVFKTPERWIEPAHLDALTSYFTYAAGFKGGGFNAIQGGTATGLPEFQPESIDSFELGFKLRGWESRIRAELAFFWGLYDNLQVTVTRPGATPFVVDRVVENAANATTRGFELEVQVLPIDGLLITGSVGFLDATYDSYTGSANNAPRPLPGAVTQPTTVDRSGQPFNGVPEWQTNVSAQYQFDYPCSRGWLEGSITPRLEWIHESQIRYAGSEVPSLFQPSVNRLNARLTWAFNDERTSVALWGKNLTDAYYFNNAIAGTVSTYGFAVRYYEPPRMYGIELRHEFF